MNMEGGKSIFKVVFKIFIISIFIIGLIVGLYFLFMYMMDISSVNKVDVCVSQFREGVEKYGIIYEYDEICGDIFSDNENLVICDDAKNRDYCLFGFAHFVSPSYCQKITLSELIIPCENLLGVGITFSDGMEGEIENEML